MNLSKWFNVSYFLQNLKKSKMAMAMFFILVPVFTALMLIASDNYTFDFISLASINLIGMYVIPFIFSLCLFGYVFKKNSVDFMGSMPISRKCIFCTNTFGGIFMIVLLQLITFLLTLIVSSLSDAVVFTNMAWDVFLYQTIAYIFVFVVANLAMTLSGNVMTQIVTTMLIIFLVPFSSWFVKESSYGGNYTLMNGEIEIAEVEKIESYTAPFFIANENYYYHTGSMLKMTVLTVLYFGIGYYVFSKKKMEAAGESFENKYVHFIVKGLTLVPFVAILKAMEYDFSLSLFSIFLAIIIVYYILYDLITSKKMKLWENLIGVTASVAIIYGFYSGAIAIHEKIENKVDIHSIKTLQVNVEDYYHTKMTNSEAITNFIVGLAKASNRYDSSYRRTYRVQLKMNNQYGKQYQKNYWVDAKTIVGLLDEFGQAINLESNAVVTNSSYQLTKQEKEALLKAINESIDNTSLEMYLQRNENSINYGTVSLSQYRDHQLLEIRYPLVLSEEVQSILIKASNRYAIRYIQLGGRYYNYMIDSFGKFNDDVRDKIYFAEYQDDFRQKIEEFILTHQNEQPGKMQDCIKLSNYQFNFYTADIEAFVEMLEAYVANRSKEFAEWKQYEFGDYYEESDYRSAYPESTKIEWEMDGAMLEDQTMEETTISGEVI